MTCSLRQSHRRLLVVLIVVLWATWLGVPSRAAHGQEAVPLEGWIVNGTAGVDVPAGHAVTLILLVDNREAGRWVTRTMDGGEFVFPSVPATPGAFHMLTTEYQGVRYSMPVPDIRGGSGLSLSVYETAGPDAPFLTMESAFFFDAPSAGTLEVVQIHRISNTGDRVVAPGVGVGDEGSDGFPFPVLPGAIGIEVETSLPAPAPVRPSTGEWNGLHVDAPAFPGSSDVVITYTAPYNGSGAAFDLEFPIGTASLDLLVAGGIRVAAPGGLERRASAELHGREFARWTSGAVGRGEAVRVELRDLPGPPLIRSLPPAVLAVIAVLLPSGFLGAYLLVRTARRRKSPAPDRPGSSRSQPRDALLEEVARLDDLHEAGKIGEREYRTRRDRLMRRLSKPSAR